MTGEFGIKAGDLEMIAFVNNDELGGLADFETAKFDEEFEFVSEFPKDHFNREVFKPHMGRAVRLRMVKDGRPRKTPKGNFTLADFILQLQEAANCPFLDTAGLGNITYTDDKLAVTWGRHMSYSPNVWLLPIYNEEIRRIIGMPEPESESFRAMIIRSWLVRSRQIELKPKCGVPRVPLLIELNLVEHNGQATEGHKCNMRTDGHTLCVVPQAPDMQFNRPQLIQFKDSDLVHIPVMASLFSEVKLRILSAETLEPASFDGVVNIELRFTPRERSACAAEVRESHPRQTREAVDETVIMLDDDY
jgi:hypothetical protein